MALWCCGIVLVSFSFIFAQFCSSNVEIQKRLEDLENSRKIQLNNLKVTEEEIEKLKAEMKKSCVMQTFIGKSHYYPKVIWTFWEDESTMPEDVKEMVSVTRKSLENFTYNFITNKNLSSFLDVSSFPAFFPKLIPQHKSDYIRTCLTEKYGGVFVDASTYVTSGDEMEWFFAQAVAADVERWGFEMMPQSSLLIPNFFGEAQHSPMLSGYKKSLDITLSRDLYEECKEFNLFPKDYPYGCFDRLYYLYFKQDSIPSRNILVLPRTRSHYRLYDECDSRGPNGGECVMFRLRNDPTVRKIPFIKVMHAERTGVKLNFEESK